MAKTRHTRKGKVRKHVKRTYSAVVNGFRTSCKKNIKTN